MSFQIFYDENGAYQDPDARSRGKAFASVEEALAECRRMVEADLEEVKEPGMSAADILARWQMWGRDPFIIVTEGDQAPDFSAWTYAAAKSLEL